MLPMVRKTAERVVFALARKDVGSDTFGALSLEIFDDWKPYGTDGFTLLTVLQPQATRLGVRFRPFQADHLAAPAAGQRKLANDVHDRGVLLLLGSVAEDP